MADTVTKISMDIYRKLEKSRVLNIIDDLHVQVLDILEICLLYNLLCKYVKIYININPGIDFFVCVICP
jgi:hypothetical protein